MFTRFSCAVVILATMVTAGCGTRVGSSGNTASAGPGHGPIAVATVIGQKPTSAKGANPVSVTVRSGADVILSGKDSDSTDAAIKSFEWKQTGGQTLPAAPDLGALLYRTDNTVTFRAPLVAPGAAPLTFRLTVTDAHGVTATADVNVTVVPPGDQNRTLLRPELARTFNAAVLTADGFGGGPLAADAPVCVKLIRTISYTTRSGTQGSVTLPAVQAETAWKAGMTVVGAGADGSTTDAAVRSATNPRVTFDLPVLNDEDIFARYNQPGSTNSPDLQLVSADVNAAHLQVALNATAGTCAGGSSGAAAASPLIVALLGADGVAKLQSAPAVGSTTLLQDASSAPLTADSLLITTTPIQKQTVGGVSIPFTVNPIETAASADAYYAAIDPTNAKTTFSQWLSANCFDPNAADYGVSKAGAGNGAHAVYTNNYDLGFGRDMYFIRCTADHTDAAGHVTARAGDMASVVINYPSLEQAALKQATIIAVAMEYGASADGSVPTRRFTKFYAFAPDDRTGEFVRVRSANFDRRGQKYLPGSCTSCHGGTLPDLPIAFSGPAPGQSCTAASYDLTSCYPLAQDPLAAPQGQPATPKCAPGSAPGATGCLPPGDVDAAFLPWDVDSLLFSDNDPAFTGKLVTGGPYTRDTQEPALKVLNQLAHATYKYGVDTNGADVAQMVIPIGGNTPVDRYGAAKTLTEYWYGGTGFPNAKYADYTDSNPPEGWADQPTPLYHTTFARNCRTCHTVDADTRLQFSGLNKAGLKANNLPDGYQKIVAEFTAKNGLPGLGQAYLYQQAAMPLARLTLDRFWVDFDSGGSSASAANTLATALQQTASLVGQPIVNATAPPGNTLLVPGSPVQGSNSSDARIDATTSGFVAKFNWSLGLSVLQNFSSPTGPPDCTAPKDQTAVALVGDTGAQPGFQIVKSGLYRATLLPDNGVGQTGAQTSYEYDICVPNYQPVWSPTSNPRACNAAPAAPYQSTGPAAPKALGVFACFTGLGNTPYTLSVSANGTDYGPTANGPGASWAASVTCNGSDSVTACDNPDVTFHFNASANALNPVPVYFRLCDVDGDCTPATGTGNAALNVTPTSLEIEPAAPVLYWAPCLNPQQADAAGNVTRCPAPALPTALVFSPDWAPIQTQHPKRPGMQTVTPAPALASLKNLSGTLVLAGAGSSSLNLQFSNTTDPSFTSSLTGVPIDGSAAALAQALPNIMYEPASQYGTHQSQGPYVTSDINGDGLADPLQQPTLIPFAYTLTVDGTGNGTSACNTDFGTGSSTCPGTVDIRALTSFNRAQRGHANTTIYAIVTGPGDGGALSCGNGACHGDTGMTPAHSWQVKDAAGTYNSICGGTATCTQPAKATSDTSKKIIIPGDPDNSPFYTAPCLHSDSNMAPTLDPTKAACQVIYQWILEGAPND